MITRDQQIRREEWKKHIEEQEKSGLSQIEFCKKNNLSKGKFGYYKGLLNPQQTAIKAALTPVKISSSVIPSKITDIRVSLPNGFQCIFQSDVSKEKIKDVIEVLLSC